MEPGVCSHARCAQLVTGSTFFNAVAVMLKFARIVGGIASDYNYNEAVLSIAACSYLGLNKGEA